MIERLLSLIAPHECLGCNAEGAVLCAACGNGLPAAVSRCYRCGRATPAFRTCASCKASPLHSVRPCTTYEGLAKAVLWRLKFERARAAAADLAPLLTMPSPSGRELLIVSVPTATSRVRQRGYDQSQLLAQQLSALQRVPYVPLLARLGQQRQVGTSGATRRRQLHGVFRVTRPTLVAKKHIVLVDDVVTSGATLEAAAAELKHAGAWRVDAVTVACA